MKGVNTYYMQEGVLLGFPSRAPQTVSQKPKAAYLILDLAQFFKKDILSAAPMLPEIAPDVRRQEIQPPDSYKLVDTLRVAAGIYDSFSKWYSCGIEDELSFCEALACHTTYRLA
jgi:hypothetical protein